MADLAITADKFEAEVLNSETPVLVDFWATWCRPCINIGPHIEALANEYSGKVKVFKVDVDSEGELATKFGIMSIPALLMFKGGQEVDRMVGAGSKDQIQSFVENNI